MPLFYLRTDSLCNSNIFSDIQVENDKKPTSIKYFNAIESNFLNLEGKKDFLIFGQY